EGVDVKGAEGYVAGVEELAGRGGNLKKMGGVASFCISRIDTLIDSMLDQKLKSTSDPNQQALLKSLLGKVANANGKLTYQRYQKIFSGTNWEKLAAKGAQTQRVLWASTSTKNPNYRDVLYIEELIGPDTVNTVPPATLDAFRDHGVPRESLIENIDAAKQTMETLAKVGISMKEVTDKLTEDGVRLFADAFDKLLEAVEKSSKRQVTPKINQQTYVLPQPLTTAVKTSIDDWRAN